ncbi:MAG: hypothetical protein IMZ53_12865 [Thermoplasmata archaeon]|nr:hypothetical protein [Thermoplasmata archaeon]
MKKYFNYIKIGIVLLVLLFVGSVVYKWLTPAPIVTTITTHSDSNYVSISTTPYTPASTPFENPKKPDVKLPANIPEKYVDRVITITDSSGEKTKIIITKKGGTYVNKEGGRIKSVEITQYLPPILSWGIFPQIGVDGNSNKVSPFIGISFLEIKGRVQLPVFTLDLDGIGIGVDYRLFEVFGAGILYHDAFNTDKSIRLKLQFYL